MIHIVFQPADKDTLYKAQQLDPSLEGEIKVICDDYAVGPIFEIDSTTGISDRKNWWRPVLAGGDYDGAVDNGSAPDDHATVQSLIEEMRQNPEAVTWIWAAQSKHDVSGYYWLIGQLSEFQGRIFILYLNNLPFINEKGSIFYPTNLFSIPPREFIKAKKLARAVTLSEFETDPDEWKRLCQEQKGVRILEGGKKLVQYDYDFYDASLIKLIGTDWIRASRLIHQFLTRTPETTGDAYLLWRLKLAATGGSLDVQGELKNMKDFEIKLKTDPGLESASARNYLMKKNIFFCIFVLPQSAGFVLKQFQQSIDELLGAHTRQYTFNGSALVAQHGNLILESGYGFSNVSRKQKNDSLTQFQVGSLSKQFTATIILQLQEKNLLSVKHDPLSRFIP